MKAKLDQYTGIKKQLKYRIKNIVKRDYSVLWVFIRVYRYLMIIRCSIIDIYQSRVKKIDDATLFQYWVDRNQLVKSII